jgi:hypothetical protein
MAAIVGPGLRDNEIQMSKKLRQATVSAGTRPRESEVAAAQL